jgi:DNA polymerase-1
MGPLFVLKRTQILEVLCLNRDFSCSIARRWPTALILALLRIRWSIPQGLNTSAVFGFTNILLWLLEKENPEYFVAVFDTKAPTFRHETYPAYKATREKMPDDMAASLPYIDEVVQALGLPMSSLKGFEADDVIGTLVHRASLEKMDSYIVSGDKDFMQLIGPGVWIYNPKKPDDLMVVDESGVRRKIRRQA